MDFNSAVQDWAQLRPPQHGNEFTGFVKGYKLLDHVINKFYRKYLMAGLDSETYYVYPDCYIIQAVS
jgi:hypothetical protein